MKSLVEIVALLHGGYIVCYWNGPVRSNKWFPSREAANEFVKTEGIIK